MEVRFPNTQEIKLGKSPLSEVICQVKFPPILRISQDVPSEFQEAIRGRFPQYSIEHGIMLRLPDASKPEATMMEATPRTHRFINPDQRSNVSLTVDFFAIATKLYTHWHDFKEDINLVLQTALKIYQPSYATRVGLRFINRFDFENTQTQSRQDLLELFRDQLTCLISTDAWEEPAEMATQMILVDGQGKLSIRTGYGKEGETPFFLLDFDYFEEGKLPIENLIDNLDRYHTRTYEAFRWSLKEESLARFQPIE